MTRPWGSSYAWVYRYLVQRDGEKCYICGDKICKIHNLHTRLIVEHKDNDERNPNPDNLGLGHKCCNGRKNAKGHPPDALPLNERERALKPTRFTLEPGSDSKASSQEKADHEKMRPRWDDWISGRVTRPSMSDYPCQLWQNSLVNIREWCDLAQIEQRAPYACGTGSSKTYHTYALEDVQGGKLERETHEGQLMVRYTHEYGGLVAANLRNNLEKTKEAKPPAEELKEAQA